MARKTATALDVAFAKAMKKKTHRKSGGDKKHGRNKAKCERYRARVGKPAGPGMPGQHKH